MRNALRLILPVVCALTLAVPLPAWSALDMHYWQGDTNTNWSTSGNWSGGRADDNDDYAYFEFVTPYQPTLNASYEIGQVYFYDSNWTISSGGSFTLTLDNTYNSNLAIYSGMNGNSGTNTINANIQFVQAGQNAEVNNGHVLKLGSLSGGSGFIKIGAGLLVFTGDNGSYSGATTVSVGTLQVGDGGATGALGSGSVTNNAALVFNRGNTITVANAISGSGSLTQSGAGTLILTGGNSYGSTTIDSGKTLQVGSGGASGTLGGGSVTDDGSLVFNRSNTITVANAISGSGSLTQSGAGTLILTGGNSYGSTTIDSGKTLQVGSGGASGTLGGGSVADDGSLVFNRSNTITVANAISGSGSLTQSGAGTLILTGGNSYGSTTIDNGKTLQVGSGSTSGTLGGGSVTDDGSLVFNRSGTVTVSNAINGTGTLAQNGGGTLTLDGTNGYLGATTISTGILNVRNSSALGSGSAGVTVADGAALELEGSGFTVSGKPLYLAGGGGGGGGGALRNISGANSWTGAITLNGATTIQSDAGSLALAGITGAGNNLILQGDAGGSTGAITTGGGSLAKAGSGTWTLGGTCTYTGQTLIQQGTLALGSSGSIANSPTIDVQSASFFDVSAVSGGYTLLPGQTLKGNGTVIGAMTVGGVLSPGESPGILHCGNLGFQDAGQFREELNGNKPGAYDELVVGGNADLTGAELVGSLGYAPLDGTRYWIITGADDLDGTFDGLPQGGTFQLMGPMGKMYRFTISYQGDMASNSLFGGHDVVLEVPEPATLALLAAGGTMLLAGRRRRAAR